MWQMGTPRHAARQQHECSEPISLAHHISMLTPSSATTPSIRSPLAHWLSAALLLDLDEMVEQCIEAMTGKDE